MKINPELTSVLSFDVAVYDRLRDRDEFSTVRTLQAYRHHYINHNKGKE